MADYGTLQIKTHSVLDDYTICWKKKLGSGSNGPVRLCKKKLTSERFAVKCLPDCLQTRTEAKIHILCSNHPHIVSVYDVYVNDIQFPGECHPKPRLLMIMELMEGGELFDRISRERCFTEKRATFYLKQITSAIKRCHSQNIAHRDLKPENMLLKDNSADALVKLTDFGFAKFDNGKLMTPHFTPYYVAPQVLEAYWFQNQIKHGIIQTSKPCMYDKSCDMWSLGVILYIMLCGYPPFYSETPSRPLSLAMRRKILTGQYEFPEQDWEFISNSAKDIVQSLLHVDPAQRMTIGQLEQTLWLNENAPDTILQSPCIIANKTVHEDIKIVHSDYLSTMRQSGNHVKLKPIEDVTNPIIQKRQMRNESESESTDKPVKTVTKNNTDNIKLKALRDIIAYCILPSAVEEDEKTITNLTIRTLYLNNNCTVLLDIFKMWDWDGEKFNQKVDRKLLARHLSELLLIQPSQSQPQLNLSLPLTTMTLIPMTTTAAAAPPQQQPDGKPSSASPPPLLPLPPPPPPLPLPSTSRLPLSSPGSPLSSPSLCSFASPPTSSYISPASYTSPSYPCSTLSPHSSFSCEISLDMPPSPSPSLSLSPTTPPADRNRNLLLTPDEILPTATTDNDNTTTTDNTANTATTTTDNITTTTNDNAATTTNTTTNNAANTTTNTTNNAANTTTTNNAANTTTTNTTTDNAANTATTTTDNAANTATTDNAANTATTDNAANTATTDNAANTTTTDNAANTTTTNTDNTTTTDKTATTDNANTATTTATTNNTTTTIITSDTTTDDITTTTSNIDNTNTTTTTFVAKAMSPTSSSSSSSSYYYHYPSSSSPPPPTTTTKSTPSLTANPPPPSSSLSIPATTITTVTATSLPSSPLATTTTSLSSSLPSSS